MAQADNAIGRVVSMTMENDGLHIQFQMTAEFIREFKLEEAARNEKAMDWFSEEYFTLTPQDEKGNFTEPRQIFRVCKKCGSLVANYHNHVVEHLKNNEAKDV